MKRGEEGARNARPSVAKADDRGPINAEEQSRKPAANVLRTFAARLSQIADRIEASNPDEATLEKRSQAAFAFELYQLRRHRERILGAGLFSDHAWDMLLELCAAEGEGRAVSTSNLCLASGAPATTALRYVALLAEAGLIQRRPSPSDNRVNLITLTSEGHDGLRTFFGAAIRPPRADGRPSRS